MNDINTSFLLAAKAFDASALRHQVLANNLANVNTPGFKAMAVSFQEEFEAAAASGRTQKLVAAKPEVVPTGEPSTRKDGNNVDMEKQVGNLAKNLLYHSAVARLTSAKVGIIRSAIRGRS